MSSIPLWLHEQLTLMILASEGWGTSALTCVFPRFHLYSLLSIPSLPSCCILIQMVVWCKFIKRDIGGKWEITRQTVNWSGWWVCEKGNNDGLGDTGENPSERTGGWRMDGGWRRRGEINMALIVSSASLQSRDQPFITPTQSVRHRHFGKWGPPFTPSAKTPSTYDPCCEKVFAPLLT